MSPEASTRKKRTTAGDAQNEADIDHRKRSVDVLTFYLPILLTFSIGDEIALHSLA